MSLIGKEIRVYDDGNNYAGLIHFEMSIWNLKE